MNKLILWNALGWVMGLLACGSKTGHESTYIVSDQYAVEINTWGMPGSETFQVQYNNLPHRPHTNARLLYVIKQSRIENAVAFDTLRVELSQSQLDTIYQYTQAYLEDFRVNNRLRTKIKEHSIPVIHDGLSFSIAFEHDNKRVETAQYRVKGFEQASPVMGNLMRFINGRLPKDFKVY